MRQCWRWFGPNDPVSLQDIRQAGASGVVSALHHLDHGQVWPLEEIQERKMRIEESGLEWVVVESVPVHEQIKTRADKHEQYLENYKQTLRNLAACGLSTVCYNFMPVLDWTRTKLDLVLDNGAKALYFSWVDLAVFDLFILKRADAELDYSAEIREAAQNRFQQMTTAELAELESIVLMGVPTEKGVSLEELRRSIEVYRKIGKAGLQENLFFFLNAIMPTCEETGIRMTLHPDDPPFPILGIPRIASNKEDLIQVINKVDHPANGICFCTGSLGAGISNDLVDILKAVGDRVYFAHLRNVQKDALGNFYESDHLQGDVDMYGVVEELVRLNQKADSEIFFRPDHGHQLLDDLHKKTNPGYSAIGRLKGLAELRGLEFSFLRRRD